MEVINEKVVVINLSPVKVLEGYAPWYSPNHDIDGAILFAYQIMPEDIIDRLEHEVLEPLRSKGYNNCMVFIGNDACVIEYYGISYHAEFDKGKWTIWQLKQRNWNNTFMQVQVEHRDVENELIKLLNKWTKDKEGK